MGLFWFQEEPRGSLSLRSSRHSRSTRSNLPTDFSEDHRGSDRHSENLLAGPFDVGRSSWPMSASIIVGEIMGTGILALPYACARLGWVAGLAACSCFGLTAIYSDVLLSRVKNDYYPQADSYGDLAHATVGPIFGAFTRGAIVVGCAPKLPAPFARRP